LALTHRIANARAERIGKSRKPDEAIAKPRSFSALATAVFRGLNRLEPLP
jgi:hypothetical protein